MAADEKPAVGERPAHGGVEPADGHFGVADGKSPENPGLAQQHILAVAQFGIDEVYGHLPDDGPARDHHQRKDQNNRHNRDEEIGGDEPVA